MKLSNTNKYKSYSDEELMKLVCKSYNNAFEELYKRYNNKLHFFFFRILKKDNEEARDCMHDLFMKIIEKAKQFDTSRKFSTWLYTLALNKCKNELRKEITTYKYNHQILNEDFILNNENLFEDLDLPYYKKQLDIALDSLDESRKIAFILRYQEELSIKEIAEIMQCPEGTIKSRIYYAIEELSKRLSSLKPSLKHELTRQV